MLHFRPVFSVLRHCYTNDNIGNSNQDTYKKMFKSNQNNIELELIRRARVLTLHKDSVLLHGPPATYVAKSLSCRVLLLAPLFPALPLLALRSLIAVILAFLLNFCCEYICLRRLFLVVLFIVARDAIYFTFSQENSVTACDVRAPSWT